MLRKIIGAIAGYIVMFIVMFLAFTGLFYTLGIDSVFEPGNYNVTMSWLAGVLILGFIAAIVGGYASVIIGKSPGAAQILSGIIIVMGVFAAIIVLMKAGVPSAVRPPGITMFESLDKVKEPVWVCVVNPIVAAIGAMIGGRLKK